MSDDRWQSGHAYEPYIGRWSRLVAAEFLRWLDIPAGARWVDVGCGTGAVTETVLSIGAPAEVVGIDSSEGYLRYARTRAADPRGRFAAGAATALPLPDEVADAAVSGLMLNFVPEPARAVTELARVTRPGGTAGVYVWDYTGEMQILRHFWDAVRVLDPGAQALDEGTRFPICQPEPLRALFTAAGLADAKARPIDVVTRFRDFDDYWLPFLGGQGPAAGYAMSLSDGPRAELRDLIRAGLPYDADGSVPLAARAWAVRGRRSAKPA